MLYNFALNFIVMRREEATKDRGWLQGFKLSFCTKDFGRFILSGMPYGLNFMVMFALTKQS